MNVNNSEICEHLVPPNLSPIVLTAWALLQTSPFCLLLLFSRPTAGKKNGPSLAAKHQSDTPPVVSSLMPSIAH